MLKKKLSKYNGVAGDNRDEDELEVVPLGGAHR